jgi:hypothetical protein
VEGEWSFRELLGRVREVCLGGYGHQEVPFEMLVEQLQPERSLSHTPLFQVMFALQNTPVPNLSLPGLALERLEVEKDTAVFDLTLSMAETGAGLSGAFEYNRDLFEEETIRRMVGIGYIYTQLFSQFRQLCTFFACRFQLFHTDTQRVSDSGFYCFWVNNLGTVGVVLLQNSRRSRHRLIHLGKSHCASCHDQ